MIPVVAPDRPTRVVLRNATLPAQRLPPAPDGVTAQLDPYIRELFRGLLATIYRGS